jgi:hypothetical protein
MYLRPAVDWQHSLIGPGGLQQVVSHLFAFPDLVLWVGLEISKQVNLNVECEKRFCRVWNT